jgi:hypothetical protein
MWSAILAMLYKCLHHILSGMHGILSICRSLVTYFSIGKGNIADGICSNFTFDFLNYSMMLFKTSSPVLCHTLLLFMSLNSEVPNLFFESFGLH